MAEPILPDLPQRLAQFQRKYSGQAQDPNDVLYPALRAASPGATSALQRLDLQRIGRGQDPYTATESAYGLTAATQQRAVTPEPDQGFFSDLISNTGDLVRGLNPFVLVPALYQEAKLLPSALQALPDTFSASSSPLEAVSNIANLPGFRFIPGSYVAGAYGDPYTDMATGREVVPGGTEQLIDNPLFTALDVLPYASKAAKLTPAYKSVTEALETQARILGAPAPRAPRPLPTVLRNLGGSVDEVSDLRRALIDQGKIPERGMGALDPSMPVRGPVITPNRVGRALDTASQRFGSTTPGRWLADLRSPYARTVAERGVFGASYLTDAERGASLDPTAARIFYDGSNEMRALSDQLDQARIPEIHRAVVTGDDAFLNTLSAPERAYVDRYTQLNEELRSYAVSEGQKLYNAPRGRGRPNQKQATNVFGLLEVPFAHGMETYSYAEGAKILDARLRRDAAQFFTDKLAEVRSGNFTHYTPESIQAELLAALDNASRFKTAELHQAVRLSLLSAQAAGFDTFRLLADWNRRKPGSGAIDSFRARVADPSFTANLKQVARPTAQQVIADTLTTITPLRTRPLYTTLHDALTRGDISAARAAVRRLAQSKVHVPAFDVQKLRSALDEVNAVNRAADRVERLGLGPKSLSKLDKKVANLERKSVPARWDDALRVEANRNIVTQIADLQSQGKLTPEQASTAIDALGDNLIARVESTLADADPAYASIINAAVRDAKESWQQLAASGLEPRFVHRVTETQAQRMANPVIFDMPNMTPRSMRSRLWDPAPAVPDLAISISHQAFDILNARASARYAEEMAQWYGVRGDELWRRYEDRGRATAARTGESVDQAIQRLVERDYTPYNPAQLLRGKKPKGQTLQVSNSANQVLVPRTVASTLERVRQIEPSSFQSAISKPMRVFRTSLLPLSPRWHLYNIVGGGIMAGSTASPRIVTTFADAFRMARNEGEALGKIESPTGMTALPPGGHIRAHNEWFESARRSPHARVGVAHSFAAGRTLSRWFGDVIEKSYAANQFVDNFYRAAAYLDGEKSALTRGMTREEAIDAGIQSAREALQSWDRLTPVERSGMRVLFPFYSWTSHLFRFVMQYPHDHPVRLAITARIAETELTDMQSGLPQKFQSMFTPFGIDADGNTTAIITDGINPFKDVTNWALLAGFLSGQQGGNLAAVTSGLNPLISTTLEVAGFDTFRGTPDLYPDLTYDPATGQLTSLSNGILPIALINNLIPQTELLTNAAGLNAEFKALAERDPEAASRQMLSNMGLPSSLVRNLNINEEAIKAEVQRYTQMQNTRAEALRTGNLGLLDQYPVLSSYRSQVEAVMASGGGGQFQPSTNATYAAAANAAQVRELGNEGTGMDLLGLLTPG